MKPKLCSSQRGKASLLDLIVMLIAVVIVVGVLVLPTIAKRNARSSKIGCVNNVKQIGLSIRMWSDDNGGRSPSQVPANEGGAKEDVERGVASRYFQVMSNELGTPKIVVCPEDIGRKAATDFATLTRSNLSYFVVPEAVWSITNLWLSGDRNLATNKVALKPGLFSMLANPSLNWTAELHDRKGYLCFADGHVATSDGIGKLPYTVRLSQSATNALRAYYDATANVTFRLLIP